MLTQSKGRHSLSRIICRVHQLAPRNSFTRQFRRWPGFFPLPLFSGQLPELFLQRQQRRETIFVIVLSLLAQTKCDGRLGTGKLPCQFHDSYLLLTKWYFLEASDVSGNAVCMSPCRSLVYRWSSKNILKVAAPYKSNGLHLFSCTHIPDY